MQQSKFMILFSLTLLLWQGCALKEEVVYQQVQPKQVPLKPLVIHRSTNAFANAKTMTFPTLNGKTITIKGDHNLLNVTNPEYQGKEVLLYLFGRDCPHCVSEISQMKKLAQKKSIKIIGIHAHKMIGDRALRAYTKKIGYHFDILSFKNDIIMIRYLKKSGLWYGGTPTHLLIDNGGNVQDISLTELLNR